MVSALARIAAVNPVALNQITGDPKAVSAMLANLSTHADHGALSKHTLDVISMSVLGQIPPPSLSLLLSSPSLPTFSLLIFSPSSFFVFLHFPF